MAAMVLKGGTIRIVVYFILSNFSLHNILFCYSAKWEVKIVEVTNEMEVRVELLGACASCSMSPSTMKAGIEEAIKRAVPEIKTITAVNAFTS